ncbi:MAG: translocation/assembly module TamB [Balneolales bacterium]|nr:translocation/assembly module TamB [Balneolales bacterium]
MGIRWLHKTWTIFWNTLGILIIALVLLISAFYVSIQFPASKNYLVTQFENRFNEGRSVLLKIDHLEGNIPFNFSFSGVSLYPDSSSITPAFFTDSISASVDVGGLIRNQFIVNSLEIYSPTIILDALSPVNFHKQVEKTPGNSSDTTINTAGIESWSLLAPRIIIENGNIELLNYDLEQAEIIDTDKLTLSNLNLNIFLDVTEQQRFLDIENLNFGVPEAQINRVNIFGQVFNDTNYLEINAFNVATESTSLRLNSRVEGVDIFSENLVSEFEASNFRIQLEDFVFSSNTARKIVPEFPSIAQPISLNSVLTGTVDSLNVENLEIEVGNSSARLSGGLNLEDIHTYSASIEEIEFDSLDLSTWLTSLTSIQLDAITKTEITGHVSGAEEGISFDLNGQSDRGFVSIEGLFSQQDSVYSEIFISMDSLNMGNLVTEYIKATDLSGKVEFKTDSFNPDSATGDITMNLNNGLINALPYDSLFIIANWQNGIFEPEFKLTADEAFVSGIGLVNIQDTLPVFELSGIAEKIDLKRLTQYDELASAIADVSYDLEVTANSLDNAFGQLTIDVPLVKIEDDTLEAHQIYADFNSINSTSKELRVTSTALDFSLNGEYHPNSLIALSGHWANFFTTRIKEELLFEEVQPSQEVQSDSLDQNFELSFDIKNLALLKSYFPGLPDLETEATGTSSFSVNQDRLLFNTSLVDRQFAFDSNVIDSLALQFTGSFRYNETIKSFSNFRAQVETSQITTDFADGDGAFVNFVMEEDSIQIVSRMQRISEDTRMDFSASVVLEDSSLSIALDEFALGNDIYQWTNEGMPSFVFNNESKLIFNDFLFTNEEELLSFDGIFSAEPEDSVNYTLRNVNLQRISDIVDGRIDFSGTLDGSFTTKSLTRIPSIQGRLGISRLAIADRVVGDLDISSVYNSSLNRFDTNIQVRTDSVKYPEYFTRSGRVGQNITLDGYLLAPETGDFNDIDSLYFFDLDFESIDLWVLPFIAPRVFTEMAGIASGKGQIWGNLSEFDYDVDYDIGVNDAVFIRPRFLDTYYYALGSINLNRQNGLVFEDMFIIDPSGGSAILSGNYDLGDLGRVHDMNLILEMDEFQFLNNSFSPDVTFFGDAYGSTTLAITGTNLNPVLSTLTPVQISDFSNIGIPLLEETKLDEDNRFIQFVNDFDEQQTTSASIDETQIISIERSEEDPFQRSFIERFTLDLQFVTDVPMTVRLIFDPVTGDIIETEGTGRLGIRLEDQQISMFGQFNISGGQYQFVSGEIFTRRFELEPGGSIVWAGSPADAQVNLRAFYQARPDINNLTRTEATIDNEESQRVPVQLALDIGGSLSLIENDFYFRLPATFELQQNSTLAAQINNLNRNEDEKLIQATSFLLMGDFIPSSTTGSETTSLTDNISGSAAVLNPILSSQVISPLLSNQVNSLLRSDIGTLDIDFNLNTYNDVDLAVALRLYNDRIILSREGFITGSQSSIGDLGATYRINQTLSVTAFHRQGSTVGTFSSVEETQQSQDINGVGVEAQVSFNSWDEFFRRLTNPFRRLFGKKEDSESVASTNVNDKGDE